MTRVSHEVETTKNPPTYCPWQGADFLCVSPDLSKLNFTKNGIHQSHIFISIIEMCFFCLCFFFFLSLNAFYF